MVYNFFCKLPSQIKYGLLQRHRWAKDKSPSVFFKYTLFWFRNVKLHLIGQKKTSCSINIFSMYLCAELQAGTLNNNKTWPTWRSFGAWTLAVPDRALRGILLITWQGPGESTSMSTRALYSSAGPSSPGKHKAQRVSRRGRGFALGF